MNFRKNAAPLFLAAAAAVSLSAPAQAVTAAFDFGANGAGLNTGASPFVYSLSSSGLTVSVRAFGNIFGSANYSNPINVTWANNNGLGGNNGSGDPHLNNGGGGFSLFGGFYDGAGEGLLLDFGQEVTLSQLVFGNWDSGDDFDIAVGNPLASGTALGDAFGWQPGSTFTPLTSYTGSQFFIAARDDGLLDGAEGFRLDGVTVNYTPSGGGSTTPGAVPEPATWAMMILGFALIGGFMRRRQGSTSVRYDFA